MFRIRNAWLAARPFFLSTLKTHPMPLQAAAELDQTHWRILWQRFNLVSLSIIDRASESTRKNSLMTFQDVAPSIAPRTWQSFAFIPFPMLVATHPQIQVQLTKFRLHSATSLTF